MVCEIDALYANGIRQCAILSCDADNLTPELLATIKDSRSIVEKRRKEISKSHRIIILSQDCDISNPNDAYIEVLVAKIEAKPQPTVQATRNYQKLQLPFGDSFLLCETYYISVIEKSVLAESPFKIVGQLDDYSSGILLDWRVGRYIRKPFPHNFNLAFITNYLKVEGNHFSDFLRVYKDEILDLHVFVSPDDNDTADEYLVSLTAVLNSECTDEFVAEVSEFIRGVCVELHSQDNCLNMVQVQEDAIPDDADFPLDFALTTRDFSLYDAYKLPRITLDYLCY